MVAPSFRCLETITYVSLAKLQPGLSYETPSHEDHEEIYYIIGGTGSLEIGGESAKFRDGDAIYIPRRASRSITNDGGEIVEFLAFGRFNGAGSPRNVNPGHRRPRRQGSASGAPGGGQ